MDFKKDMVLGCLTTESALSIFDGLECVDRGFMLGRWKGREVATGHPMDGLLDLVGWYGKLFIDQDNVHPLLFYLDDATLFSVNPGVMPVGLVNNPRLPRLKLYRRLIRVLKPLVQTRKGRARLRMVGYRGGTSAAMCYDQLPIIDCFRKIDNDTVLGAMDLKGAAKPYFFMLERDDTPYRLLF